MASRSAIDTIKGYFYQFDLTIEKLLNLPDGGGYIEIEKIEDIDVSSASETTAVQCKYYSKTEYNHSVIAKPIRFMISHYKVMKDKKSDLVRYKLYGHYKSGQDKLQWPLDVTKFKEHFLSYTKDKKVIHHHDELGLSEQEISEFINLLDIDVNAKSYDEQLESIFSVLRKYFSCTEFEAEHYYYNNALKKIKDLAVEGNSDNRIVSKSEFLKSINKKEILFNSWFMQLKGETTFCRNIKRQYFQTTGLSTSPFERIFGIEVKEGDCIYEIKHLILHIQKKWSKLSRRDLEASFCPYVYIHGLSKDKLLVLKKSLRDDGTRLIDGVEFDGDCFNADSISRKATFYNEIKIKIINEIENLYETLSHITKTIEVYQFYIDEPFIDADKISALHVKIQIPRVGLIKEVC